MMDYDKETAELKVMAERAGTHDFDDFIELMPSLSASMKKMHETLEKMKQKKEAEEKKANDTESGK